MRRDPSRPVPWGVEALLHGLARNHMESLPSGIPRTSFHSRWRGTALCAVARLGNHYRDRHGKLLVDGVARHLLSRITDHGLRTVAAIVVRRSPGLVGLPILLSGV